MRASFFRFASVFRIAAKSLLAERGLALATALGLTAAVALAMSVPLYADGVYFRLLHEAVAVPGDSADGTPLSFRFRYVGARDGARQLEDVQPLDAYLAGPVASTLRLPARSFIHHYKTDIFRVHFPDDDLQTSKGLTWVSFGTLGHMEEHIQLRQGQFPASDSPSETVEVLISESVAQEFAWQVGETLLAERDGLVIPIRIAGTWAAAQPQAGFWSSPLEELALVSEQTFAGSIAPRMDNEVYLGLWQVTLDGSALHASDVAPLLSRVDDMERQAAAYLPRVVLDSSPIEALQSYRQGVPELTFLLLAYSVPMMGLLLAFIGLVGGLHVERRRNQIAILRSRGATTAQVAGIAALEGAILGALALVLGSVAGMGIAGLIGRAQSFLQLTGPADLRITLTREALGAGLVAVTIAQFAQLAPALAAAGNTIVAYKQQQARLLRPPWWQRAGLDFALLIPTGYGFFILQRQGRLAAAGGAAVHDIFQDPLLFLTPALGLFALTLFVARALPLIMGATAWLAGRTRSVGLLLASRQLSRAPGMFTVPLVLLILTLSLSAFTASLARTLDGHLAKQEYYRAGADLRLAEMGVSTGFGSGAVPPPELDIVSELPTSEAGARWFFQPVEAHLQIPEVRAAARVGRYPAVVQLLNAPVTGVYIGIDRLDFPQVAYWEPGFSPASLGTLMNELARTREGVIVTRDLLAGQGLRVGDPITIIVTPYDTPIQINLRIVGVLDLFPTWYPEEGPLFVGNLDYLFEEAGIEYPYDVWLRTQGGADQQRIVARVRGRTALLDPGAGEVADDGLNIMVTDWNSAPLEISAEQQRPQRQGLFGLLSVGFVASALLTVLGFLLYALFSFRRRFIQIGILRAVGLSLPQLIGMLGWELASLILIGIAVGTGLGTWVSAWFIPYLQVGVEASSRFPPFTVVIDWPAIAQIYMLFGLLFIAALVGLIALLARMHISQAVKIGETA